MSSPNREVLKVAYQLGWLMNCIFLGVVSGYCEKTTDKECPSRLFHNVLKEMHNNRIGLRMYGRYVLVIFGAFSPLKIVLTLNQLNAWNEGLFPPRETVDRAVGTYLLLEQCLYFMLPMKKRKKKSHSALFLV